MSDRLKIHKPCRNQLCSCSFSLQPCCWLLKTQIISLILGKGMEGNRDMCSPNFKTSKQQLEVFTFPIIRRKRKWCWELCSPANPKIHVIQIQKQLQSYLIKLYPKRAGARCGIAGSALTASGSCEQQPNGSRNSSPRKNIEHFSTYKNSHARNSICGFSPQHNRGGKGSEWVRLHYQYCFPAHSWVPGTNGTSFPKANAALELISPFCIPACSTAPSPLHTGTVSLKNNIQSAAPCNQGHRVKHRSVLYNVCRATFITYFDDRQG